MNARTVVDAEIAHCRAAIEWNKRSVAILKKLIADRHDEIDLLAHRIVEREKTLEALEHSECKYEVA